MKKTAVLAVFLMIACSVALFAGGQNEKATASKSITLSFYTQFSTSGRAKGWPEAIAQYEAQHPNVKIKLNAGSGSAFASLIQTAMLSGNPPDMLVVSRPQFETFIHSGLLYNLTKSYKALGWDKRFYPLALLYSQDSEHPGQYYGLSTEVFSMEWFYNADIFQKLGLNEPADFNALADEAAKLRAASYIPVLLGAKDKYGLSVYLGMVAPQTVGSELFEKTAKDPSLWTSAPFRQTMQILQDMEKRNIISANETLGVDRPGAEAAFLNGQVGIYPEGSYTIPDFNAGAPKGFHYNVFAKPIIFTQHPKAVWSGGGGQLMSISEQSADKQAAVDFLDYFTSVPVASKLASEAGGFYPEIGANTTLTSEMWQRIEAHMKEMNSNSALWIDVMPQADSTALLPLMQELIGGKITSEQLLQQMAQIKPGK